MVRLKHQTFQRKSSLGSFSIPYQEWRFAWKILCIIIDIHREYPAFSLLLVFVLLISHGKFNSSRNLLNLPSRIHYLHHIHWLKFKMSLWVYPILNELSFMYRGLFLLGSAMFNVGLYFIGEMYTLFLTSIDRIGRSSFIDFDHFRFANKQNECEAEKILERDRDFSFIRINLILYVLYFRCLCRKFRMHIVLVLFRRRIRRKSKRIFNDNNKKAIEHHQHVRLIRRSRNFDHSFEERCDIFD